jgi:UDP-glucose 4-epimerase
MMRLLVTGGAGYIGSVVAAQLLAARHEVTVLDDLSTGHADAVPDGAKFVQGTLREDAAPLMRDAGFDAVLHFAAKSLVAESVAYPERYWSSNLGGTLALLDAMKASGTRSIVFSSTAATYGEPETNPIPEDAPTRPINPYGQTKLAVDTTLTEFSRLYGFGAVSLRYFNVAGAFRTAAGQRLRERHNPESHLIPNVLAAAKSVLAEPRGVLAEPRGTLGDGDNPIPVMIYGDNYPTTDGTCVRDYIHVSDLADAHLRALDGCVPGQHRVFNLGNGAGFSVKQVVDVCREVTGIDIPAEIAPRRPGDPAVLVASSRRITDELGWHAANDLTAMVFDAWTFTK